MSSYNMVVITSIILCAILSLFLSYYLTLFILGENSSLFKIVQLISAILLLTTLYSPIKHILFKFVKEEREKE